MEVILAICLAAAVVAAAWAWADRDNLKARERRLRQELSGMKRALQSPLSPASSSQVEPLPPDRTLDAPAAPPAGELTGGAAPPSTAPPPAAAPFVPSHLLELAERHRDAMQRLDETLSRERLEAPGPAVSPGSVPAQPEDGPVAPAASPLVEASASVEHFLDEASRLRSELQAIASATSRVLEAMQGVLPLAREAKHQSQSLSPVVEALSGLADRLNLLALDVTLVAAKAAAKGISLDETSVEIRSLFEETRAYSRNLGTRVRKAAEAAHGSEEALSLVLEIADGARDRAAQAGRQGEKLAAIAARLEASLEAVRTAAEAGRVEAERLLGARRIVETRLAAETASARRLLKEAGWRAELQELAREVAREERRGAEELLAALRSIAAAGPHERKSLDTARQRHGD